jgi:hypothetical protein
MLTGMHQVETVNGRQISGNWRVSVDLFHYMGLQKDTLEAKFDLTAKARKALEASKTSEGLTKQANFIYAAVYQVAENLGSIFKDFSKGAGDVMEAVVKTLKNPRYSGGNFTEGEFGEDAFDKPFATLVLQVLNSQGNVRSSQVNVTSAGKAKSAASRFNDDDAGEEEATGKRKRRTKAEMEAARASGNAFANFRSDESKKVKGNSLFESMKNELLK